MSVACSFPETPRISPCPKSHFQKFHLNIIHPSTPWSSKWALSFFRVSTIKPYICLSSTLYALHGPPTILHSILGDECRTLSSCVFLHSPVTSAPLAANTIQSIPFWIVSQFELQQFTILRNDIGTASVRPYVDLQVLLPLSNLFSAHPFRCYTLPYFTTHWTLPSLPQVIKTLPFLCSYAAMTSGYDLQNNLFLGRGGHCISKLSNGVSEIGSVSV